MDQTLNPKPSSDKNAKGSGALTQKGASQSNSIQIPQIELPNGGGAIKGIDEKFQVNAANTRPTKNCLSRHRNMLM